MNVTDAFHAVELFEQRCELHFACGGLWDLEKTHAFIEELNAASLPLIKAGKPIFALGDFSDAIPQDRECAAAIGDHVQNAKQFGLKRVAIVNASALMMMQYKRVSAGIDVEFFDSKVGALNWLREDRKAA